jgi:hypothetical protein
MSKTRSARSTRRPDRGSIRSAQSKEACPLCKIMGNEKLIQTFRLPSSAPGKRRSWSFFIVPTKNKKGHDHRYMVVLQDHVRDIDRNAEAEAVSEFFGFMKKLGADFAIMESTHATIGNHWHRVGTDLNPNAEDAKQILDTERFEVRFKKAGN